MENDTQNQSTTPAPTPEATPAVGNDVAPAAAAVTVAVAVANAQIVGLVGCVVITFELIVKCKVATLVHPDAF